MNITRREALGSVSALGLFLLTGGGAAWASAGAKPAMTVYRSPSCGCCGKWVELAKAAGYPVSVQMVQDVMAVKSRLRVPDSLASCHTTTVAGYLVEGHVPFRAIDKLVREKPKAVAGIAVPGMPAGSPGMEAHGSSHAHHDHVPAIEVFAFTRTGVATPFAY